MPYLDIAKRREHASAYAKRPGVRDRRKVIYKAWAITNRDRLLEKERTRRSEKRGQCLIAHARIRARKKGVPFDLAEHDQEIQSRIDCGICELTGHPFDLQGGARQFASPSLDRIIPSLGYIYSNIRIICFGMNAALGNWGEDALLAMLESWQAIRSSRSVPKPSSKPA